MITITTVVLILLITKLITPASTMALPETLSTFIIEMENCCLPHKLGMLHSMALNNASAPAVNWLVQDTLCMLQSSNCNTCCHSCHYFTLHDNMLYQCMHCLSISEYTNSHSDRHRYQLFYSAPPTCCSHNEQWHLSMGLVLHNELLQGCCVLGVKSISIGSTALILHIMP